MMMARTLIFLSVLFTFASDAAAAKSVSALERLRRVPAPDNDCKSLEADLRVAMAPALGRNGPIIREGKIDWIVRRLEGVSFPAETLPEMTTAAFRENPQETFRELTRLSMGECTPQLQKMAKLLINTAMEPGQAPGHQKKVVDALRKWFRGGRTPTLARARADFEVIESALRAGLWKIPPEKTKSMERERNAMMSLSREVNKIYYGSEAPEKFTLENADFKKLEPTFVREVQEASTWLGWVKSFVAEIP